MKHDPRLNLLEGCARELAAKAGYDAGERLVVRFGGQRLFVPAKIGPRSRFNRELGPITAQHLADLFGGSHIEVPTGEMLKTAKRKQQICSFLSREPKASKNQVAQKFSISRRTVQRHRSFLRSSNGDREPDLFEPLPKR